MENQLKRIFSPCVLLLILAACSKPAEAPSDDLTTLLKETKDFYSPHLPKMADEDTRIDSIETTAKELKFNCTLVTVTKDELDLPTLTPILQKNLREEAGRILNLSDLLKNGATLVYSYKDKNGVHLTEIRINLTS